MDDLFEAPEMREDEIAGRPLAVQAEDGWTFELTTGAGRARNPQLLGPPTILAIVPGGAGADHFEGLRDALMERQPTYAGQRLHDA